MSAVSRPREAPVGDFFRYATRGSRAGQWEAISMDTEASSASLLTLLIRSGRWRTEPHVRRAVKRTR